jgi:hypothetical protein
MQIDWSEERTMNTQANVSMRRYFKRLACGGRPICARLAP